MDESLNAAEEGKVCKKKNILWLFGAYLKFRHLG